MGIIDMIKTNYSCSQCLVRERHEEANHGESGDILADKNKKRDHTMHCGLQGTTMIIEDL